MKRRMIEYLSDVMPHWVVVQNGTIGDQNERRDGCSYPNRPHPPETGPMIVQPGLSIDRVLLEAWEEL